MDKATLTNGIVIERGSDKNFPDRFPALMDIVEIERACDICPIRILCDDNDEFSCQTYGMFEGFYMGVNDALEFVGKHNDSR